MSALFWSGNPKDNHPLESRTDTVIDTSNPIASNRAERIELTAADGVPLIAHVYDVDRPAIAIATALMMPGIGLPQRAFRHLATWLSARGVRCLTVDFRGIGESTHHPESISSATLLNWARLDAVTALEYAEQRWSEPLVMFGHSFGGQLVGLAEPFDRLKAAVLIAAQIGLPRYWDGFERLKVEFYWRAVLPIACSMFDPLPALLGFGTRLPRGAAAEWARWGRSPDWFFSWEDDAAGRFAAFNSPVLAFAIADDGIAPSRAVDALLDRYRGADVKRRDLHPHEVGLANIGHVGFFRPGAIEPIWDEALNFIRLHVGTPELSASRPVTKRT
ncbi:MAG: alpha/beta hydrolase family protein [Gammaproteobacteria bacterium]